MAANQSHLRLDQISAALVACAQPLVALGWRNVPEGTELAPGDADAAADLLCLALGFYKVEKFRAMKEAKFRPFEDVAAEMEAEHGVPFTLVTSPPECSCVIKRWSSEEKIRGPHHATDCCLYQDSGPVQITDDLRVPPVLQRVTDLQPLQQMQEALGDAVQSLDEALAEAAAKGPENEVPS